MRLGRASYIAIFVVTSLFLVFSGIAYAAKLEFVSDVISTSAPATSTTHRVQFRATSGIPVSGRIVITPESGHFTIPVTFDYTSVDLATAGTLAGPYTDRTLSSVASAVNDGVSVVTGTSGSVTITLNSTTAIAAGDYVQVELGTSAAFGTIGTDSILNPDGLTSYYVHVETRDALNALVDSQPAMIAIVSPVTLTVNAPIVEPQRSNGLPSGLIAANNNRIELSLETDILATCRYATSTGVAYDSMPVTFNPGASTIHYVDTTPYSNDTTYNYYVRCRALGGGTNVTDFPITFTLKPDPISNTSIESEGFVTSGPTGNLGSGGTGEFPNGSNVLYYATVMFRGTTVPGGVVTVLKDGVKAISVNAQGTGNFETTLTGLERGAYGFQLYVEDSLGLASSLYVATLSVAQGTNNEIVNILLPPTAKISKNSIQAGEPVEVSGSAPPNLAIQLRVEGQTGAAELAEPRDYTATSSASGLWEVDIDTKAYAKGTYLMQAFVKGTDGAKSAPSKILNLAVGSAGGAINRSDINRDGKVNLIDFSILLSFWNTANPDADINEDGNVNLGDFSIMLFNWTG